MSSEPPDSAFLDTSVCYNYTFEDDAGEARCLIQHHPTGLYYSSSVVREFKSVKERRETICDEALGYIDEGRLDEFEPSNPDDLSCNDFRFIDDFIANLEPLSPVEQVKRINKKLNQLQQGWENLFLDPDPLLMGTPALERDSGLMRTLEAVVENRADCRIISDAVEWCDQGYGDHFITSDKDDILGRYRASNDDRTNSEENTVSELPDSFVGFIEGDDRSRVERINDIIERTYSDSARLRFYSAPEFLEAYPIAEPGSRP